MAHSKGRRVSPEEKFRIALKANASSNISQVAFEEGLSRDSIYRWRRELRTCSIEYWRQSCSGRRPEGFPTSIKEAYEENKDLRNRLRELEQERALARVGEEYYKTKLEWLEEDVKKKQS